MTKRTHSRPGWSKKGWPSRFWQALDYCPGWQESPVLRNPGTSPNRLAPDRGCRVRQTPATQTSKPTSSGAPVGKKRTQPTPDAHLSAQNEPNSARVLLPPTRPTSPLFPCSWARPSPRPGPSSPQSRFPDLSEKKRTQPPPLPPGWPDHHPRGARSRPPRLVSLFWAGSNRIPEKIRRRSGRVGGVLSEDATMLRRRKRKRCQRKRKRCQNEKGVRNRS